MVKVDDSMRTKKCNAIDVDSLAIPTTGVIFSEEQNNTKPAKAQVHE